MWEGGGGGGGPGPTRPAPARPDPTAAPAVTPARTTTSSRSQKHCRSLGDTHSQTPRTSRSLSLVPRTHLGGRRRLLSLHSSFPRKSYLARRPPGRSQSLRPGRGSGSRPDSEWVGSASAGTHGTCSLQQGPAGSRAGQDGGTL